MYTEFSEVDLYVKPTLLTEYGEESVRAERTVDKRTRIMLLDIHNKKIIPQTDIISGRKELSELFKTDALKCVSHSPKNYLNNNIIICPKIHGPFAKFDLLTIECSFGTFFFGRMAISL